MHAADREHHEGKAHDPDQEHDHTRCDEGELYRGCSPVIAPILAHVAARHGHSMRTMAVFVIGVANLPATEIPANSGE